MPKSPPEMMPSSPSEPSRAEIWACRVMIALYLIVFLLGMAFPKFSIRVVWWAMIGAAQLIERVVASQSLGSGSQGEWLGYFGLGVLTIGLFLLPQYIRRQSRKTILLSPFALWALTLVHAAGSVWWAVRFVRGELKYLLM